MTTTGLALVFALSGAVGCKGGEDPDPGPGPGQEEGTEKAFLTIIGDDDLLAEDGDIHALAVLYHDENDEPLAGVVYFRIEGDAGSTALSRNSTFTDDDGIAAVDLAFAGTTDFAFEVVAEAADAPDAKWRAALTTVPLDPTGSYNLVSSFDLPAGPPTQDLVCLSILADAIDDPFDPATWLLDEIEFSLLPPFGGLLAVARSGGFVDAEMNDVLAVESPAFAARMFSANHRASEISHTLGLESRLDIIETLSAGLHAKHTLNGWIFWLDGEPLTYTEAELELTLGVTEELEVAVEKRRGIRLDRHAFEIPYGDALWFGINRVMAPSVDPYATSLASMMTRSVDCGAVGSALADRVGTGGTTIYELACSAALLARADDIQYGLSDRDATLIITGDADMIDTDGDRVVERLEDGNWTGLLVFPSDSVDLSGSGQGFAGSRAAD
ncbi:MAG: hypothetical protein JRF63_06980 [Deltaproteobacteria bacterium]|nr:hypothetical protein [Deltaproteobacteria bacterium]